MVDLFDREFATFIESLRELTELVPAAMLYRRPPSLSIGENIIKSAGVVEQAFGGITTNLWDDPFEWTLPETLPTPAHIIDYLAEVESTRVRAFATFGNDSTLLKLIVVPSGDPCPILKVLLETLTRASDHRGRATATLKMLSDVEATGFII